MAYVKKGEAGRREYMAFIDALDIKIEAVDAALAQTGFDAWLRYGKGRHPAALNFGDCFSYALAKRRDEPLLFKGKDFASTDIRSALPLNFAG